MTNPYEFQSPTRPPASTSPRPAQKRSYAGAVVAGAIGLLLGVGAVLAIMLPLYNNAREDAAYYEKMRDEAMAKTKTETVVSTKTEVKTETVTVTPPAPTSTQPPAPTGPTTSFGDGTWMVGQDIAPGTYKTSTSGSCYWERLKGLSGQFEDIIANGLGSGGQVIVTIAESDKAFRSQDCGTWGPA